MATEYKVGEKYYLPVVVEKINTENVGYRVNLVFLDGGGDDYVKIMDKPGLLLTSDEIIDANIPQAINRKDKEIEILIDKITKLEAELTEERKKNNG
jgi:hypothetical protein